MEFPAEVWRLIFNHLDEKSLKTCLAVSENFRGLVIDSPRLMRKLPVIFYRTNWRSKIPFVTEHGDCVRAVKFDGCQFSSERQIANILKLTSNLEVIVFQGVTHGGENIDDLLEDDLRSSLMLMFNESGDEQDEDEQSIPKQPDDELNLKKLEKLMLDVSSELSTPIMKALKNSTSIKSLMKRVYFDDPEAYTTNFLIQLKQLENLFLDGDLDDWITTLFNDDFEASVNFKLKIFQTVSDIDYNHNFSKFFMAQSESLEELHVKEVDFYYFRMVLNNFHSLKKLSFCAESLLNDTRAEEIKNLKMPNVIELNLLDCCEDSAAIRTLLGIFPNVEVLTTKLEYFSLHGIIEHMPKLRKLVSNPFKLEMMLFAKSSSLTELEIGNVYPLMVGIFWQKLAEDCPNIERLTVADINIDRLAKAVNADIGLILENLIYFKKLKFCELINDTSWSIDVVEERGVVPHAQDDPTNQVFRFLLESDSKEPAKLSITNYFNTVHSDAIRKIVENFHIAEVVNIDDPNPQDDHGN